MRNILALLAAICCAVPLPAQTSKSTPAPDFTQFNKKLSGDQEVLHALDRLTFGPRPGDVAAVKKMGLSKWIDLQLHPERIPENEALTKLVEPLVEPSSPFGFRAFVNSGAQQLFQRPVLPQQIITAEQVMMLRAGTAQQNLEFINTLPRDKAVELLTVLPAIRDKVLPMLDADMRQKVQAAMAPTGPQAMLQQFQVLIQGAAPQVPLQQLIPQEQVAMLRTGSDKQALEFLATLPRDKTLQVLAAMPAVRNRLLPLLDPDLRKKVEAAVPSPAQPGQTLAQGKLYRAIQSDRQLEEVLVDFWYNHFNVDASKGNVRSMVTAYERDTIRPHVLGKFRDLLEATANSPAMMFYLDNWQSSVEKANGGNVVNPSRGLNENYARELMELHTLGVDGGYTQKDIIEIARCFTGWTIDNPNAGGGTFTYNDQMHDKGEKTVLGVTIPAGGGKEDGEKVLDILARHPSTAKFISRELAQRFVADDPPPALIERIAKTFRETDGDIRAVLTTLFDSKEFLSQGAYRSKLKSPLEMVVSAVRATGAQVDNTAPLVKEIATLGEPLYRKLEPTGYSNRGADWVSSASLLERMNFALSLAEGLVDGATVTPEAFPADPAAAARKVLFTDPEPQTLEAIGKALNDSKADPEPAPNSGLVTGMVLGSPDFQRR